MGLPIPFLPRGPGGQAAYYWFFTKLMIITAIIFIPFAIVYRTKTYLHDKEEGLGPFTIWTQ